MPIWAVVEVLEFGQLASLYRGFNRAIATDIALAFGASNKKMFGSWIGAINYIRNVSAHHARLFNRKLVQWPKRPAPGMIAQLDHLAYAEDVKKFGLYPALAILAFCLRHVDAHSDWPQRMKHLLMQFPTTEFLSLQSIGAKPEWLELPIWEES